MNVDEVELLQKSEKSLTFTIGHMHDAGIRKDWSNHSILKKPVQYPHLAEDTPSEDTMV